jgi:hypothetical protein
MVQKRETGTHLLSTRINLMRLLSLIVFSFSLYGNHIIDRIEDLAFEAYEEGCSKNEIEQLDCEYIKLYPPEQTLQWIHSISEEERALYLEQYYNAYNEMVLKSVEAYYTLLTIFEQEGIPYDNRDQFSRLWEPSPSSTLAYVHSFDLLREVCESSLTTCYSDMLTIFMSYLCVELDLNLNDQKERLEGTLNAYIAGGIDPLMDEIKRNRSMMSRAMREWRIKRALFLKKGLSLDSKAMLTLAQTIDIKNTGEIDEELAVRALEFEMALDYLYRSMSYFRTLATSRKKLENPFEERLQIQLQEHLDLFDLSWRTQQFEALECYLPAELKTS